MGQLPFYRVDENIFPELMRELDERGLQLICTQVPALQSDGITMYRGWEVKRAGTTEVIMWDKHRVDRDEADSSVELTVGTPAGRKGMETLKTVEQVLDGLGGRKLT